MTSLAATGGNSRPAHMSGTNLLVQAGDAAVPPECLPSSANAAVVVAQHERALHHVGHGGELVLAEHLLDEGEDALRRGRPRPGFDSEEACEEGG